MVDGGRNETILKGFFLGKRHAELQMKATLAKEMLKEARARKAELRKRCLNQNMTWRSWRTMGRSHLKVFGVKWKRNNGKRCDTGKGGLIM